MLIEPSKATGSVISPLSVCSYVSMLVCKELISETAPAIFLKLGMKLGNNKGKKDSTGPIFDKNSHFGRFWPNVRKNDQNHSFWGFEKNDSNKFSEIALKVSPKTILHDRIVILLEKIHFWG